MTAGAKITINGCFSRKPGAGREPARPVSNAPGRNVKPRTDRMLVPGRNVPRASGMLRRYLRVYIQVLIPRHRACLSSRAPWPCSRACLTASGQKRSEITFFPELYGCNSSGGDPPPPAFTGDSTRVRGSLCSIPLQPRLGYGALSSEGPESVAVAGRAIAAPPVSCLPSWPMGLAWPTTRGNVRYDGLRVPSPAR